MPRNAQDNGHHELRAEQRYELRRATRLLEGSGLTILEAVKLALEARAAKIAPIIQSASIEQAIDGFLARCLKRKLREQTFDFYERKLRAWAAAFPGRALDEVTRDQFRAWLNGLGCATITQRGFQRSVSALYNWARAETPALCSGNPAEKLKIEDPIDESEPTVLQAAELRQMLEAAGPYRHAIALMLFAGIRPDEIAGRRKPALEWRHIDRAGKTIRIPADISKTRKPRVIEDKTRDGKSTPLPAALWEWLADGPAEGLVCPTLIRQAIRQVWPALRKARPDFAAWPRDVLRHTAASYLLALWSDEGRVKEVLGHEGASNMLWQYYRAVMTQAQAKEIAALAPRRSRGRGIVVPISA